MAGWLTPPTAAVHVAFGNVLGEDRKMCRSRSGGLFVYLQLAWGGGSTTGEDRGGGLTGDYWFIYSLPGGLQYHRGG